MFRRTLPFALLLSAALPPSAAAETLTIPFVASSGVLTSGSYSGQVEITVSGTGWSLGPCLNDAFYVFSGCGSPYYDSSWYHLRINSDHPIVQVGLPAYAASHVYSFTYTLPPAPAQVRFWVSDGNFSDNGGAYTIVVEPANEAPIAEAGAPASTVEGGSLLLDGSASSDSDGTIVQYAWDCDDDGTFEQTGPSPLVACSYADDGWFTARLLVTDDLGATAGDTAQVQVANLDPTLLNHALPFDVSEGQVVTFHASASDPGPLDVLSFSWDWGDGTPAGSGDTALHAFPDDGTFAVTLTVQDGDGGQVSATWPLPVANVAPVFTSAPPGSASEGALYEYQATISDPAGPQDPPAFALMLGPAGMTVTPGGLVQWTPTLAQALLGGTSASLRVGDGDGGLATQGWTVAIGWIDADADGMADTWETDQGLDPTDPGDAALDPDGDGVGNLDEFLDGTDPFAFGGPGAPLPLWPVAGAEAGNTSPDLLVANAVDPDGDPLDLAFEVYADPALAALVASCTPFPEDPSGQTSWKVDAVLAENAAYWWRARAADPWAWGPWSSVESFVVNQANEPPTAPVPASPLDGETVGSLSPLTQWGPASDPDGDAIDYEVEVRLDAEGSPVVASAAGLLLGASGFVEWTVVPALAEDTAYQARARASDEHGLSGPWSETVSFFATSEEGTPAGVVIIAPEDGSEVTTRSPLLVAGGAVDPEGQPLVYAIEVSSDPSFADVESVQLPEAGGQAAWDLAMDGILLPDDAWAWVRARAGDGLLWSAWAQASFFIDSANDPPSVPVLLAPAEGSEAIERPIELLAAWSQDVDLDALRYRFVVAAGQDLADPVVDVPDVPGGNALADGAGEVAWSVGKALAAGTWYWSVQAADEHGLASGWAVPGSFVVVDGDVGDDDVGDDDAGDDGQELPDCGCAAGPGGGGALALLGVFALGLLPQRGRRSHRG